MQQKNHQQTNHPTRNGRWRSTYTLPLSPSPSSLNTLTGTIKVDVHYYEDGNVRLLTNKSLSLPLSSSSSSSTPSATEIMKQIAQAEKKYQEELNRAFGNLSEGAFKGLRRQLPVTRQRVEWEKIGGYRVRSSPFSILLFLRWVWSVRVALCCGALGWFLLSGEGCGGEGLSEKDADVRLFVCR